MTDDRSRQGYEDVLSSVRRLVSNEIEQLAEERSDKLLLTPALRVDGAAEQPEEPLVSAEEQRDFPTLEDRIAELEAAVGAESTDWEPDGSEDLSQHEPSSVVLPLSGASVAKPSAPPTAESDLVFAVPGEPVDGAAPEDPAPDAAEAPAAPTEAPTSEAPTSEAPTSEASSTVITLGPSSAEPDPAPNAPPAADAKPPSEVAMDDTAQHASAEDTAAQISEERAQPSDAAPSDADAEAKPEAEVKPTQPPEAAISLATFRHRGDKPVLPPRDTAAEDEPALLDEASLRDLVAEIVREELQGGLGERITRNVRKLVRAEIQRAFAARDLD